MVSRWDEEGVDIAEMLKQERKHWPQQDVNHNKPVATPGGDRAAFKMRCAQRDAGVLLTLSANFGSGLDEARRGIDSSPRTTRVAAAAPPRLVSSDRSTSQPRRRRDSSKKYPRDGSRGVRRGPSANYPRGERRTVAGADAG